jgi:hypothetical protein
VYGELLGNLVVGTHVLRQSICRGERTVCGEPMP